MNDTVYVITYDNYEGDNFFELYHDKLSAEAKLYELRQEGKEQEEYKEDLYLENDGAEISWFDANYNEFSTFITLTKTDLESLFFD